MEWVDPLVRGGIGLLATGVLIAAARIRFRQKGSTGGPADMGLD